MTLHAVIEYLKIVFAPRPGIACSLHSWAIQDVSRITGGLEPVPITLSSKRRSSKRKGLSWRILFGESEANLMLVTICWRARSSTCVIVIISTSGVSITRVGEKVRGAVAEISLQEISSLIEISKLYAVLLPCPMSPEGGRACFPGSQSDQSKLGWPSKVGSSGKMKRKPDTRPRCSTIGCSYILSSMWEKVKLLS